MGGVPIAAGQYFLHIAGPAVAATDLNTERHDRSDHLMTKGVCRHFEYDHVVFVCPPPCVRDFSDS